MSARRIGRLGVNGIALSRTPPPRLSLPDRAERVLI